ncbi:MAG: SURF1 family cytochrome oxidase biogenesis protein [Pseudomonadota bacterium]
MAIRFRPMPGLTVAALICLPILIGLGVWQYQRWQWKTDVLAEIDAAVTAPPLQGLQALIDADGPLDFRRIQFDGTETGETFLFYSPEGNIAWMPFRVVEAAGETALVGFPTIADGLKETASAPTMAGPRAGYVRRVRPPGFLSRIIGTPDNPTDNRWFSINPDGVWLDGADLYIDVSQGRRDASQLPVQRPDIPNNHVSYMLTWWSFAIILLVIYAILHIRAGRLSRD